MKSKNSVMFHKIKEITPLADYRLYVRFEDGAAKIYDVKPLFDKWAPFRALAESPELFSDAVVDVGGCGVVWNDDIDLSCEELYENGVME